MKPSTNYEPLLYSRQAAARALNITVRSIDLLVASGSLEYVRIGSRKLIRAGSLHRLAEFGHNAPVRERVQHG